MYKTAIIFLASLLLCANSCALLNNTGNNTVHSQDIIIGKWKLVKVDVPRRPTIIYSSVEVILEFKSDNILTVKCLRQDNNCSPWNSDTYQYYYIDSDYGTKIQIGTTYWWYSISEKQLMIGKGPVDGLNYFFERM